MIINRVKEFIFLCSVGVAVVALIAFSSNSAQTISGETAVVIRTTVITPTVETAVHLPIIMHQPAPTPTSTPTPVPGCIPPAEIPSSNPASEDEIISAINEQRDMNDYPLLLHASELVQSSRRHSLDMATNNFTGHTGSDGSSAGDRARDACYESVTIGEIIGWGFGGNTASMIDWWMNSPIHKDMILSARYEDVGAGYIREENSEWGHYWTVNFGKRGTQQASASEGRYTCEYKVESELGGSSLLLLSTKPCVDFLSDYGH